MNTLFICPNNSVDKAGNLLAVLTNEPLNKNAFDSFPFTLNDVYYSLVSVPSNTVDINLLTSEVVRPIVDTNEIIDIILAEECRLELSLNTFSSTTLSIFHSEDDPREVISSLGFIKGIPQ